MTTTARIGYGTLFQTGDGNSPEAWTTLAEVTSITPPNMARDSIDASHEQSPDGWREFIAGMKDGGDVTIEMNFDPDSTSVAALMAELNLSGPAATKTRRILFPDTSTFDFEAFLTAFEPDAPLDDRMTATATFKITGRPFLTQAV